MKDIKSGLEFGFEDFLVDKNATSLKKFSELKKGVKSMNVYSELEGLDSFFEASLQFYIEELGTNFMDLKQNFAQILDVN